MNAKILKSRCIRIISLAAALMLMHIVSSAQQQSPPQDLANKSIEELMNIEVATVYGASKYVQKVTEAPASVSIVTSEDIEKYGYRSLAEILRSVKGFYATYDRNYNYLGVRGFARPGDYNTRVLLLINGHRVNDNVYDQAAIGIDFPVDVDLIERVEVIRGPSSSLYGTSAFFAVINVITKRGSDVNATELSGEVASLGTYKARTTFGKKFGNGVDLLLSGTYYRSAGQDGIYYKEFDNPPTSNGFVYNADSEGSGNFFANLSYKNLSMSAIYGHRHKGIPTAAFGTIFNDSRTHTNDDHGIFDLQYERTLKNGWNISARAAYDSYHYYGTYIYDEEGVIDTNKDSARADWWSAGLQLSKRVLRRHRLTFGSEYHDNFNQDQQNYGAETGASYVDVKRTSKNVGSYIQDEFAIRENLLINAGVRYDYNTDFGGTAKPRFALIFQPAKRTTFKLLYGEAFRNPNNYESHYYEINRALPPLERETIRTTEFVVEQYIGRRFRISGSAYQYKLNNLITQQAENPNTDDIFFTNVGRVTSKGLELEFESKLAKGMEARVAYTAQDTHDAQTGLPLTNSPVHLGKLNFSAPLFKKRLFFNFEMLYASKRRTLDGTETDAVWLPNLTLLSKRIANRFDLSFGVYNLFNRSYGDPGAEEHLQNVLEQDGRTLRLKFTYRF